MLRAPAETPDVSPGMQQAGLPQSDAMQDTLARLEGGDAEERRSAVYEVEPEGRGLEALAARVSRDPDAEVRQAAVIQLGSSLDPHVSRVLIPALSDPDPGVVAEAIDALASLGDASAVASLRPLLGHPDLEIRERAAGALELLSD